MRADGKPFHGSLVRRETRMTAHRRPHQPDTTHLAHSQIDKHCTPNRSRTQTLPAKYTNNSKRNEHILKCAVPEWSRFTLGNLAKFMCTHLIRAKLFRLSFFLLLIPSPLFPHFHSPLPGRPGSHAPHRSAPLSPLGRSARAVISEEKSPKAQ